MLKHKVESFLQQAIVSTQALGGGCIAKVEKITTDTGHDYFLKYGVGSGPLKAEANSLREISTSNTIAVPDVLAVEEDYLLLSYIPTTPRSLDFFETFARQLAAMHRSVRAEYGFYEDNFIGSTPQLNIPSQCDKNDWTAFYFNKRLKYQFDLSVSNGYVDATFRQLFSRLENKISLILGDGQESPCLLHGDLWGGNYMVGVDASAVLIDPAVYYGHREADLAMTRIFGGFTPNFYSAYQEAYPLADGWEYRENIYRLYHILNHLNLFGVSYYSEALELVKYYVK